ncbi:MAG: hypothetical protein V1808_00985 [Candidatus Daviesbacteria bacterium]
MKKIIILVIFVLVLLTPQYVGAKEASDSNSAKPSSVQERVVNALEKKLENKLEDVKANLLARVRNAAVVRWEIYNKLIATSEKLLTKLQERIDKAKALGMDTKLVDVNMADAKTKLADAKTKLEEIKSLKETAMDKKTFLEVQKKFQAIHKDLNAIRLDGAKIISSIKSFNTTQPKPTNQPKPTKVKNSTTSATTVK